MKRILERLLTSCAALFVGLALAGCAEQGVTYAMSGPPQVRTDIFPGNYPSVVLHIY